MSDLDYSTRFLDTKSVKELAGVDWRLACITAAAIQSFILKRERADKAHVHRVRVTDGFRTPDQQQELVTKGLSQTLKSLHLEGRAVDLAYIRGSKAMWDWTWYQQLDDEMQDACRRFGLDDGDIVWGGHWTTLRDGVHWQLMLPPVPVPVLRFI